MQAPRESSTPEPDPLSSGGEGATLQSRELLGTVGSRCGELLIIDFGLLRFWSGDTTPHLPDGLLEPSLTESLNRCVDYELVGADARRAAELLDMAAINGTYVFDVPRDDAVLTARLQEIRAEHRLDSELRRIPRMPHRERVRRLLGQRPAGTDVNFHGGSAVAISGFPTRTELPVYGERMSVGSGYGDKWKSVWVEVDNAPVIGSHLIGYVLVDEARLMFADPDALSSWRTDESLDGRADLVFWGQDAELVAAEFEADRFEEFGQAVYGWKDQPDQQVHDLGKRLAERRRTRETHFVFDYRPHDDDHRLLSRMRPAPTESASIDVGGTPVCGLFTTWGDGAFPVYRDVSSDGKLLRFRVELGAPEIVTRQSRMEKLWFGELSKSGVASQAVLSGSPIGWLERGAPFNDRDSGWSFYAGTETEEELSRPDAATIVPLRDIIERQPDLEPLLDVPPPVAFEIGEDQTWHEITPPLDD